MSRTLQSLAIGLVLLLVAAIVGGDHGSSLWPFVGRFHPLLVHLPITFVVLATVAELATRSRSYASMRELAPFALLLTAWSGIVAGIAGLLLADWGSYDPALLFWHRRLGLLVPACAALTYWFRSRVTAGDVSFRVPHAIAAAILFATVVVGGHLGGTLVRGEGYLTRHLPTGVRQLVGLAGDKELTRMHVANPESTPVFDSLVQPILVRRCGACHNPERKKGGLILTNAKGLFAGGRQGKVVVAGRADDSEMIIRLSLPPGHLDAMPPDRAIPGAEIALVRWWIDQGASTDVSLSAIARPASIRRTLAAYGLDDLPEGIFALSVAPPDTASLAAVRATGLAVQTLGVNVGFVSVDAASVPSDWAAGSLDALRPLARHVASVDLARTSAGDAALVTLGMMPHVTRLQLSRTRVTDSGLQSLKSLQYLEYLNLVDTDISDDGLRALEQLPRLRSVYLWGTRTTPGGVARLQRALPRANIRVGAPPLVEPPPPPDSGRVVRKSPSGDDSC